MQLPHHSDEMFRHLAVLEVPYGLAFVSDPSRATYDDPRSIAAIEAKYPSLLAPFGVKSLHIHQEVPTQKKRIRIGEFNWEYGLMDMERVYAAPESVCDLLRALQRECIPFAWFLYAEERFAYPKVAPLPTQVSAPPPQVKPIRKIDPAIIGVIPTDYQRRIGWWYLIAAWLD